MANRLPLVLNTSLGQLEQFQTGDTYNLNNDDVGTIKNLGWNQEYANGNSGGGITIDWTNGNFQSLVLTDNCLLNICTGTGFPYIGRFQLRIKQNANNAFLIQWADSGTGLFSP